MPLAEENVMYFISFLSVLKHSPSTIASHLSALAYKHKLNNLSDPTQCFKVKKMLAGCRKLHPKGSDSRKPIDKVMLSKLCDALPALFDNRYTCKLYNAAFCLAFYAFLRVGELTLSNNQRGNILQFGDIMPVASSDNNGSKVQINFKQYKHSNGSSHSILVQSKQLLDALLRYEEVRGAHPGPYLINQSRHPITRQQFSSVLVLILKYCGYPPNSFNTHSFRIGAATHAANTGMSEAQIKYLGRWKSDAFLHYIRQAEAVFH